MGYRSDVAIKCGDKAFEMFVAAIKDYEWTPDTIIRYGEDGEHEYYMGWSCIKWYETYDFVIECNRIMHELDELFEENGDKCYHYKFVRIGEDMEDNEERCNDYDTDIYISRVIDMGEDESGKPITI